MQRNPPGLLWKLRKIGAIRRFFLARDGTFQIKGVPPGLYKLEVWYELASAPELASASRELEIKSGDNALATITLHSSDASHDHLNKYGEPYPLDKPSKY